MWLRLAVDGVLVRSVQRVVRATMPQSTHLARQVDGLARGYMSRVDTQLFAEAPDLGVAEPPKVIRPQRADQRA